MKNLKEPVLSKAPEGDAGERLSSVEGVRSARRKREITALLSTVGMGLGHPQNDSGSVLGKAGYCTEYSWSLFLIATSHIYPPEGSGVRVGSLCPGA